MIDEKNTTDYSKIFSLDTYYFNNARNNEERQFVLEALEEFARKCEERLSIEESEVHFELSSSPCRNGVKVCPDGSVIPCDQPCGID